MRSSRVWMRSIRVWMRSSRVSVDEILPRLYEICRVWMRSSQVWMRSSRVWMRSSRVWMRSSRVWMRSSRLQMRSIRVWMRSTVAMCDWDLAGFRMRSSRVFIAYGCQCQSRNSPGFDPRILQHIGIWEAVDKDVLNNVHKKKDKKIPLYKTLVSTSVWSEILCCTVLMFMHHIEYFYCLRKLICTDNCYAIVATGGGNSVCVIAYPSRCLSSVFSSRNLLQWQQGLSWQLPGPKNAENLQRKRKKYIQ